MRKLPKNAKHLLAFLTAHSGWQSLGGSGHPNSPVKKAARALEKAGLIEIARHSGEYGRDWQARLLHMNPKRRKKKSAIKKVRSRHKRVTKSIRYKITAQNTGKRMHYDGRNFSERTPKIFALADDAKTTALMLIRRYPVLRKYKVRVESFP